jgi:hypothetical protein
MALLAALIGFITLLGVGVVRRWRCWTFWLVLVAFLAGVLRVPVAIFRTGHGGRLSSCWLWGEF